MPDDAIKVSDCANVTAMASSRAFSQAPDLSGHQVGGAIVSESNVLPQDELSGKYADEPADAVKWADELEPLGGPDTTFKFVRIPGSAMITRLAGDEANQTAAAIAAMASSKSDVVVLAREDDFADALGATGLAGALRCPIVLTNRESLSPAAAEEITALGTTKCYIIGGSGAMKEQLESDLKAQTGVTNIERLWGENSYDTSLACAKQIMELRGNRNHGNLAIVAMSMNFQDALSISPFAYKNALPVVLQTWGDTSAERGFHRRGAGVPVGHGRACRGRRRRHFRRIDRGTDAREAAVGRHRVRHLAGHRRVDDR